MQAGGRAELNNPVDHLSRSSTGACFRQQINVWRNLDVDTSRTRLLMVIFITPSETTKISKRQKHLAGLTFVLPACTLATQPPSCRPYRVAANRY